MPVTVRKPRPSKTVYENYFPVWAIVLIAVGAAAAVAGKAIDARNAKGAPPTGRCAFCCKKMKKREKG